MKKLICFVFICLAFPSVAAAQKNPAVVSNALASGGQAAKMLKPLSNAAVESLAARGKSHLVIQRALGVAEQRHSPLVSVLQRGEINRALLKRAWRSARAAKYRWEEGNMLGLNAWLMVLAHRVREGVKLSQRLLTVLEEELSLAQTQAEQAFRQQYQYSVSSEDFEKNPAFRSLLGEAVAQRLNDNFLPLLSSADRVRLLKVLMQGVFAGPVDLRELHTAALYQQVRAGLAARGSIMRRVERYGEIKEALRFNARRAAEEAALNGVASPSGVKRLFIQELKTFIPRFSSDPDARSEWEALIAFYEKPFAPGSPVD